MVPKPRRAGIAGHEPARCWDRCSSILFAVLAKQPQDHGISGNKSWGRTLRGEHPSHDVFSGTFRGQMAMATNQGPEWHLPVLAAIHSCFVDFCRGYAERYWEPRTLTTIDNAMWARPAYAGLRQRSICGKS